MPDILGDLAIGEPAFRRFQPVERRDRVQRVCCLDGHRPVEREPVRVEQSMISSSLTLVNGACGTVVSMLKTQTIT